MKPKILIVEDDLSTLTVIASIVRGGGYQPVSAHNARAALDILKNEQPQLIIQDLSLPDLNGVQLIHCIRLLPNCEKIPVIIVSGCTGRLEAARLSSEHFVAFLNKPIDPDTLLQAIKTFLPIHYS